MHLYWRLWQMSSDVVYYRLPLLAGGVLGLLAALLGLSLTYEDRLPPRPASNPRGFRLSDYIERRSLIPALMILFTAFSTGAGTYMIVFAADRGFASIGAYYLIDAAASLAAWTACGHGPWRPPPFP